MPEHNYRVINSTRRKRIAFRFAPDGILEILSPPHVTIRQIEKLIDDNLQIIDDLRARTPEKVKPSFTENHPFWLLGKNYPLHLTCRLLLFDNKFMIPKGSKDQMKTSLIHLYRQLAEKIIRERIQIYQQQMNLYPEKIRISSANCRWGSCSASKTLSFNWKLIQCPLECVDYVIVHELAHLAELNHSTAFWKKVAEIFPDYRDKKRQLNAFATQLPIWE